MNPVRTLRHFAGFLLAGTATLFATAVGQPPAGLDEADWARLRSTLDVARHRIAAAAGGHQAHNPGQHWRTRFEGQGFLVQPDGADWQWGLELTAYGFPGREHTVPTGSANTLADVAGSRLEYAWDAGLTEWFVNDVRGLEHGFTVHERPDDRQVLECGDRPPLSLHHDWLTDAGHLHDLKEKRRPAGAVQDVYATATLPAIHYPPSTLNFRLAVRGGLRPVLEPDRRGVRFVDADGTTRTTYAGLKVWDADGRILPAHFEPLDAGRPAEITLAVDERGARYPLTIDPLAQQAYLKPADVGTTQARDWFGFSVAVSGDTVIVGAPNEDSRTTGVNSTPNEAAIDSGAAYVFVRSGTTWIQQAYLKPAAVGATQAGDGFGLSVAVSGDTVVVGAKYEGSSTTGVNSTPNEGAGGAGAAYVFVRSGTMWTQQAYLKPAAVGASQAADYFGSSVAVEGDTVVVGAPLEDSGMTGINSTPNENVPNSGAAYVFVRSGTTWSQQAYLKPVAFGTSQAHDLFGTSVAVAGDTVIVGAPHVDSGTTGVNSAPDDTGGMIFDSGAAYVFVRSGTTWAQEAYLKPPTVGDKLWGDYFGYSVAVAGDTVVIGAPLEDSGMTGINSTPNENAPESGAAYVFVRSGTEWTQQAYLKPAAVGTTQAADWFGISVAVSRDTAVVGAHFEDSNTMGVNSTPNENAPESGAAYVFTRTGTVWKQRAYLKPAAVGISQSEDYFGLSLAISGKTMVVGALHEDSGSSGVNSTPNESAAKAGAAYIFEINDRRIRVEQPAGVGLTGGASIRSFGAVSVGGSVDLTFTVRNSGTTNLTDFALSLDGTDANEFSVTANPTASLAPGESTTFTARFSPTSEGTKTATLHIASNDPVHNPFDLTLIGTPNVPTVAASGNDLTVSFVGTPGSRYRVQYLPGLTGSWTDFAPPALYTVPASGVISHTDLNPPDTLRLYRAVLAP